MKTTRCIISRLILLTLCITVMMGCVSCDSPKEDESFTDNFVVADAVIIHNAEIYDEYAVLPLLDAITAIGFELTYIDEDRASFVCNDIECEISISKMTLRKKGDNENYLIPSPGSENFVCDVKNGILMVDDATVQSLFSTFLEYPIRVFIDRNNNVVVIYTMQ